jgi:hypothetical protein
MIRLLFAAARGARIEVNDGTKDWRIVEWTMVVESPAFRIHPDDAHLQYGPISTALRELELDIEDKTVTGMPIYVCPSVISWYNLFDTPYGKHCSAADHRSLFLLILAEALADEGL